MQVAVNGTPERLAQHRHVLAVDLLLQVLGAGGDEHAVPAQDGRHQVGHGLAGARAGLGQQHAAVFEDRRHGSRHAALPVARLVVRQRAGERPIVGEGAGDRVYEPAGAW